MRNWNEFSINSLNTTENSIRRFQCQSRQGRHGDIFKPTFGNQSLYEISNVNGVAVVNFATSKNLSQKYDVPTSQHP
jgi:hypothetical protein